MLTYFPRLYKDELLYSWFARYHLHSANISPKQTMRDLYGNSNMIAVPDLPTDLLKIYENIQHFDVPDVESWIKNHTFYRYYTSFLSESQKEAVYMAMEKGTWSKSIHLATGVMASSIKDIVYFRYCKRCVQEDLNERGETYWRLLHQLPSVFVCNKHNELLVSSKLLFRGRNRHEYQSIKASNLSSVPIAKTNEKTTFFLTMLTEQTVELMEADHIFTVKGIQSAYKYLLQKQGFANFYGTVNQEKLAKQFISFYGQEFLELVQSNVDYLNESCWLKNITRKQRKSFHPIRHMLIINFVGERINSFYQYAREKRYPFGKAPYYCLNPAADHYHKRVIPSVTLSTCTGTRRPVGTFKCTCGFIYSRRGPDITSEDAFKIGRVKHFGQVWLDRLQLLVTQGQSDYAISKTLNCDIGTVKKI